MVGCVSLISDLNLLDWSSTNNQLALVLSQSVYLWNPTNGAVTLLCESAPAETDQFISSVSWNSATEFLAVGNSDGEVQVSCRTFAASIIMSLSI